MHRSSESIGAIAAALAKAQIELINPQKSLVGVLEMQNTQQRSKSFRYASLAEGLDIVRKSLGSQEIAVVQTTSIDRDRGQVRLTTLLAHASGEWITSDWPVCQITEMVAPRRMGAALTYARRYALFSMVGIAGEDDLDAPDLPVEPAPEPEPKDEAQTDIRRRSNGSLHKPRAILPVERSMALRERLIAEVAQIEKLDALALWAHKQLAVKNALAADDAKLLEDVYERKLRSFGTGVDWAGPVSNQIDAPKPEGTSVHNPEDPRKPLRLRNKAHRRFVSSQPCLVCQKSPCDPHHIKFAQPMALGRKVSDEFTVPLCREHHRDLHRFGNERAWWANQKIKPLEIANDLWTESQMSAASAHQASSGPAVRQLDVKPI
jgi:ERF superfamily